MFETGVVVSAVIALGQFFKQFIPSKFAPLVTLIAGIAAGLLYLPHNTIEEGVFNGIVVALSANGLFDLSKMLHKQ